MAKEQSSSKMSTLASKYVNMNEREFWDLINQDGKSPDEQLVLYHDLKSLAASVLTQDEQIEDYNNERFYNTNGWDGYSDTIT